jgi:hypothetical protein
MAAETGRKALIIVTDATDQGSVTTIKQAVEAAQRADTLIQVLVVYDEKAYANFDAAKKLAAPGIRKRRGVDCFQREA